MRTLLAAALLLASTAAHANSPELQAVSISALACQLQPTPLAKPRFDFNRWQLSGNGSAVLLCPVPVAGRAGVVFDRMRIAYLDPDARGGNSSVRVQFVITQFDVNTSLTTTTVCRFRSNFDGPPLVTAYTVAEIACPPVALQPGSYAMVAIELWRRKVADSDFAAFIGIDFP